MKWVLGAIKTVVAILAACALIFVLVEGGASTILLTWDLAFKSSGGLNSRKHVQFDPELGWVSQPNLSVPGLFGPGADGTINGQSLRARRDFTPQVPAGRVRVLCSGDSFTFGVGNRDGETWCDALEAAHPTLETMNAGEPGYGVDQMYLKARRLANQLRWDVHVTAFIGDDVRRITTTDFIGRAKPRVVLDEGELSFENQPVERPSEAYLWFRANKRVFQPLRFLELAARFGRKSGGGGGGGGDGWGEAQTVDAMLALFEATRALAAEQGALAVFVYLPSGPDVSAEDTKWLAALAPLAAERGLVFIDLVSPLRALDDATEAGMYTAAWRHYSADGNRRVADALWTALGRVPEVAARLGVATPPPPEAPPGE